MSVRKGDIIISGKGVSGVSPTATVNKVGDATVFTVTDINGTTTTQIFDGEKVQYSTLPTASADNLGKIVQYTGTTDNTYINGYYYQVVSNGESTPIYSWENIQVQESGEYIKGLHYVDATNASRCIHTYEIFMFSLAVDPDYLSRYVLPSILLSILQDIFSNYIDDFTTNDLILKVHANYEEHILKNASYRLTKNMSPIIFDGLYNKMGVDNNLINIYYTSYYNLTWANDELTNVTCSSYSAIHNYSSVLTTGSQYISGKKTFSTLPESSVTPTSDNQLTRKGYVDALPTTYTGYDATKTQILKNVNGTLTWVDE